MVKVLDYFTPQYKEGEVGVEVEIELEDMIELLPDKVNRAWNIDKDGSLKRGYGYEFVLRKPHDRGKVFTHLRNLYECIEPKGMIDSGNAGIHIHINVQDMDMQTLIKFLTLCFLLEWPLVQMSGEKRPGNLFCLRGRDAEGVYNVLHAFTRYGISQFGDNVRYGAVNLKALKNYGSVEFRSLASPCAVDKAEDWIHILLGIKDNAHKFDTTKDILMRVSEVGPVELIREITPKLLEYVEPDLELEREVREDMWNIQAMVFDRNIWEEGHNPFNPDEYHPEYRQPPRRNPRKGRVQGAAWPPPELAQEARPYREHVEFNIDAAGVKRRIKPDRDPAVDAAWLVEDEPIEEDDLDE